MSLIKELRRRNVLRVGAAYLAGSWLLIQIVNEVASSFEVDAPVGRIVIILLAIGFIPALVISWAFEWTPKGPQRDVGEEEYSPTTASQTRLLDRLIIVILAVAVTFFAVQRFVIDPPLDLISDKSVAILPCSDLSEAGDQEYFADGIAIELLTVLSGTPELRVPARTSAFAFKGTNATISEIADSLNVAHVLECSVRRAGQQLRITAQLIEAASEARMWTQSYDREMGDVFAIQDDIAGQVVEQLQVSLLGAPLHVDQTTPEIFELHTLAEFVLADRRIEQNEARLTEIRGQLEQAIIDDPDYFPIRRQLALVYDALEMAIRFDDRTNPQAQGSRGAEVLEMRSLREELLLATYERFPDKAEAIALYMVFRLERGFSEVAVSEIQRAHELDPHNPFVLTASGMTALELNRPRLAAEIYEYVVNRDLLCAQCRNLLLRAYYLAGEYEKARSVYEESTALGMVLGSQGSRYYPLVLIALGEYDAALEACREHEETRKLAPFCSAMPMYLMGRHDEYQQLIAEFAEYIDVNNPIWLWHYIDTGQHDLAFEWMEAQPTLDERMFRTTHQYQILTQDPRWPAVGEKFGLWPDPRDAIRFEIKVPEISD